MSAPTCVETLIFFCKKTSLETCVLFLILDQNLILLLKKLARKILYMCKIIPKIKLQGESEVRACFHN